MVLINYHPNYDISVRSFMVLHTILRDLNGEYAPQGETQLLLHVIS